MSEVNLVYQMYNTLSKSDKMRFMQMLGMPPQNIFMPCLRQYRQQILQGIVDT